MKPYKIPRSIKVWLFLLGFWIGNLIAGILLAVIPYAIGIYLSITIWGIIFVASLCLLQAISFKYKETLEEWGLIEKKV